MQALRRESAPSGPRHHPARRTSHSLGCATRETSYRNAGQSLFQSWFTTGEFLWPTFSMADIEVRPLSRQAEQMIWDQEPFPWRGVVFFIPKMMGGTRALNSRVPLANAGQRDVGVGRSLSRLAVSLSPFCHARRWSKGHKTDAQCSTISGCRRGSPMAGGADFLQSTIRALTLVNGASSSPAGSSLSWFFSSACSLIDDKQAELLGLKLLRSVGAFGTIQQAGRRRGLRLPLPDIRVRARPSADAALN
jgi:hypothetical protein